MLLNPKTKKRIAIFAAALGIVWLGWFFIPLGKIEGAGELGDKFGSLNTLFTGAAFIGLVATLFYQQQQVAEAKSDLETTLAAQRETTAALKELACVARAQSENNQKNIEAEIRRSEMALLKVLHDEIHHAWDGYTTHWLPRLDALSDGGFLMVRTNAPRTPFPIFAANSANLGQITDDRLRRLIIAVFAQHRAMLGNLEMNARLLEEYQAAKKESNTGDPDVSDSAVIQKREALVGFAAQLKKAHVKLFQQTTLLLSLFKDAGIVADGGLTL